MRADWAGSLHVPVSQDKKADTGAVLRERLKVVAGERRRFSYRRLGILLQCEGFAVNHKKLFRLYREEGLAVRRRRGRKRALGTRKPTVVPSRPGERWSLDFVSDSLAEGRKFRALCIVDAARLGSMSGDWKRGYGGE